MQAGAHECRKGSRGGSAPCALGMGAAHRRLGGEAGDWALLAGELESLRSNGTGGQARQGAGQVQGERARVTMMIARTMRAGGGVSTEREVVEMVALVG